VASSSVVRLQCGAVKAAHGPRGHQLDNGRFFASGEYFSRFSVERHKTRILNKIYFVLHHLMDNLSRSSRPGETQLNAAARIHRDEILGPFFDLNERQGSNVFQHTKFCPSCLFETASHTLACGHTVCPECIKAYGQWKNKTVVEISECPIGTHHGGEHPIRSIYFKPAEAGLRILSLDE
jgi:hypothetical protein